MRIQYNGKSKILIRLAELVNQKADAEDLEQTAADLQKEIDEKADKSAIPTVGDGVLSVQRNGKSVGTFSANAAKDTAINIPIPKKVSELERCRLWNIHQALYGYPKERPCKRCAGKFGQGGYGAAKASGYQRQARQADCRCKHHDQR